MDNTNKPVPPAAQGGKFSKRKLVLILIVAAVIGGGYVLWSQGYVVDIARFFASEPAGYVPIAYTYPVPVPVGGDVAIAGAIFKISWVPENFPSDNVRVTLMLNNNTQESVSLHPRVPEWPNVGYLAWNIPRNLAGNFYTIRIQSDADRDYFSAPFSILPAIPVTVRPIPVPQLQPAWRPGSQDVPVLAFVIANPHEREVDFSNFAVAVEMSSPGMFTNVSWDIGSSTNSIGESSIIISPNGFASARISIPHDQQAQDGPLGCAQNCPALLRLPPFSETIVYIRVDVAADAPEGTAGFAMRSSTDAYTIDRAPVVFDQTLPYKGPEIVISGPVVTTTPPPGDTVQITPLIEVPFVIPGQKVEVKLVGHFGDQPITAVKVHFVGKGGHVLDFSRSRDFPEILARQQVTPFEEWITLGAGSGSGGRTGTVQLGIYTVGTTEEYPNAAGEFSFTILGDSFATRAGSNEPVRIKNVTTNRPWQIPTPTPPIPAVPGDANGDGKVDIFDYNLVISNFGSSGPDGDVNGDGKVDIFDYNLVISNFGN